MAARPTWAALLLLACCATSSAGMRLGCSAASGPVALQPRLAHSGRRGAARHPALSAVPAAPEEAATASDAAPPPAGAPLVRARAWLGRLRRMDKATALAKAGSNFFFAYGFVSNVNAGGTIAIAWGTFTRSSGLSPFASGQWSRFLAVYLSIYLTVGTVLRPVRLALAVWITPAFDGVVRAQQSRLPFGESRPRLNRTLALVVVSLLGNMLAMLLVTTSGVWLSSLLTGVPVFPPGFQLVRR